MPMVKTAALEAIPPALQLYVVAPAPADMVVVVCIGSKVTLVVEVVKIMFGDGGQKCI